MNRYTPDYTTRFRRNRRALIKRGYDMSKLARTIDMLIHDEPLPPNYRDHPLKGNFRGCRECHIEGEDDWLLIYKKDGVNLILIFTATGTHSDLFI
jgi:mRNA interferase YafQ